MDYIKTEDIKEKIIYRFRFDFWMEKNSYFVIKTNTNRKYHHADNWISIGIIEPKKDYRPLWDVYAPTQLHKDIIQERLKSACIELGGRYAYKFQLPDTIIYTEKPKKNSKKLL